MKDEDATWSSLRAEWQRGSSPDSHVPSMESALSRSRNRALELVPPVVSIAALALLAMAVHHAADLSETVLAWSAAFVIMLATIVTWLAQHRERTGLVETTSDYLAVLRRSSVHRLRLAQFIWVVIGAETVFLVRWWAGGIRVHERDFASPLALLTLWLPLVTIIALLAWSGRLYRRAVRELRAVEQTRADFLDADHREALRS
jgi:hypothetical protein